MKCICDIKFLFSYGCGCGNARKEIEASKKPNLSDIPLAPPVDYKDLLGLPIHESEWMIVDVLSSLTSGVIGEAAVKREEFNKTYLLEVTLYDHIGGYTPVCSYSKHLLREKKPTI